MRPAARLRVVTATLVAALALHGIHALGGETTPTARAERELRGPAPFGTLFAVVPGSRLPLGTGTAPLRLVRRAEHTGRTLPILDDADVSARPRPAPHARSRPVRVRVHAPDDPVPDREPVK